MIKLSQFRLAAVALALVAWLPLQAGAGILDDDEARRAILDLRTKVDALSRDFNARIDTKAEKSSTLEMLNQHEQTMQELARLRGQLEVLANEIANAQKSQRDLYADLDARIKKLEPRQETIDGRTAEVQPSEKKTYDAAMELYSSGDYKSAVIAMQDFARRYPDSAYAPNAQYGLGASYFALKDYKNAIAALETVLSNYGASPKAPEAMLSIGSSYVQMKDAKKAKSTWQALIKKYPDSSAAALAKERLAALK
jgi:tol-pal system protein YbgF